MLQHPSGGSSQPGITCANHECVILKHRNIPRIVIVKLALLCHTLCTDKIETSWLQLHAQNKPPIFVQNIGTTILCHGHNNR